MTKAKPKKDDRGIDSLAKVLDVPATIRQAASTLLERPEGRDGKVTIAIADWLYAAADKGDREAFKVACGVLNLSYVRFPNATVQVTLKWSLLEDVVSAVEAAYGEAYTAEAVRLEAVLKDLKDAVGKVVLA